MPNHDFNHLPQLDTLKIYLKKSLSIEEVTNKLVALGYKRVDEVLEEGDFSLRGDLLEVFPINFNFPIRIEWAFDCVDKIYSYDRKIHSKMVDYTFVIIIPHLKKIKRYSTEDFPLEVVLKIEKGDFVVHSQYGIGKFLGVKKLKIREGEDYYFTVEYANKDKVYVAKEEAHLIQKYISFSHKPPKLSSLNNRDWLKTKERVERGIKLYALEFIRMQAERKLIGGFTYSKDDKWHKTFRDSFPYEETPDQTKAMQEVNQDMESGFCMDRIICGDVGYGKTEVAMRAAFKAVVDGKQVAFLVPTTILAYQHYTNLKKRLKEFPFYVEMLSRFRSKHEQTEIIKNITKGKIDIIVGTHRLLSQDIAFKDLGLLIVDEEHKFGVKDKDKIKKFKVGIDILTLTATPIPRTLYMGLSTIKNISLIKTPPKERISIKTKIMPFSYRIVKEAVMHEINRGGQVFFIHNRIETIEKIEGILKTILPKEIKIGMIHGRLHRFIIEKVMLDFLERRLDILLSTAIVESGIDIPTANTIIINDAHMFGLADLHQLRGRVGRFNLQAYAYLLTPNRDNISSDANERLEMIEKFSHLGAGFDVAMSDLELRGAGNILGSQQHGFVWLVGFDLYCRLLRKEIDYLKEAFKIKKEV